MPEKALQQHLQKATFGSFFFSLRNNEDTANGKAAGWR
jgi:hypothetical protein